MSTGNYNMTTNIFQRLFLRPLGLDSDNALVFWLLLLSGALMSAAMWFFEGNVPVVIALFYVITVVVLSFVKVEYSVYLFLLTVLLFDQYGIPEFEPLTYQLDFFRNLKEISFLPQFSAGVVNPLEIHLLFIIFGTSVSLAFRKDVSLRGIPAWFPFLLLFGWYLFSFIYGMGQGGDFMPALWEVRALFYLFLMYLIIPQVIQTRQQIKTLIWIFIVGITFKAFQGLGRFIELGYTTGGLATLTNHEDPVFMVTLLILLLGFIVFRFEGKQRWGLIILALPLLLGFYVGLRRAAYASLMVSGATFVVLLPAYVRWDFIKYGTPFLIGALIYLGVFWNYNGTLGRPAQMIKSGLAEPTMEENYSDYMSNLYRANENYNLARTVENHPLVGIGFGVKYDQPLELIQIRFPLMDYIPHNEIIWIMVKMGAIGFFLFWLFFNSFVARGVGILKRLRGDPYLQAVTVFIVIAIINQMTVSFYDLQLTYYRNMIYLGTVMGMLSAVDVLSRDRKDELTEVEITREHKE